MRETDETAVATPSEPEPGAPEPSALAPSVSAVVNTPDGEEGEPWVLRLGNYLKGQKKEAAAPLEETPWAVKLGSYLNDRKPGPWSIIANEKPQDPLALRLGTFLNELGGSSNAEGDSTEPDPRKPLVLRLGNYLNGNAVPTLPTSTEVEVPPPPPPPPLPVPAALAAEGAPTSEAPLVTIDGAADALAPEASAADEGETAQSAAP